MITWTDSLEIAISLEEAHPDIDPITINFVDLRELVMALEDFDEKIVGRILAGLSNLDEPVRVLIAPDHRTPIVLRTHSREPVPFVLWGKDIEADRVSSYSEAAAESGSTVVEQGHQLMDLLMASK